MTNRIDTSKLAQFTLAGGQVIPATGMGTFGSDKYGPEEIAEAVAGAIRSGYRLFDCASVYGNEDRIGQVFAEAMRDGVVTRDELYVTSKVWNDAHGPGRVLASCKQSLADLQLDYVDTYFLHWPFPNYHAPGASGDSRNPDSKPFSVERFMATWHELEELVDLGLARSIGMSNMTIAKLEAVLPLCRIRPVLAEMELHPGFQQPELLSYYLANDIRPIGFSPLGSPSRPERDKSAEDVVDMELPEVVQVANRHGVHPAAICLSWAVRLGAIPIPFSIDPVKYENNLESVIDVQLSDEDMALLKQADRNNRLIKGQVFLWDGASDWQDLWDVDGVIAT